MKKTGRIILISISLLYSVVEYFFSRDGPLLAISECSVATVIAWFVGWQFDKLRLYAKEKEKTVENYRQLLELFPKSVIIHRYNKILYANKSALELIGASEMEEVKGRSIVDFLDEKNKDNAIASYNLLHKTKGSVATTNQKLKCLDGRIIYFEETSVCMDYEDMPTILSIYKDITESKEQTEQLLQKSEKLALVGQMAAGIAHEIRNPLTSIKGFIQLFRDNTEEKSYYDIVLSELDRINHILGEFLVLARPSVVEFKKVNIAAFLHNVSTLVNTQSILANVEIEMDYEENLPYILGEENQLKQVFLNIIKNSIEAMPEGGIIRIVAKSPEANSVSIFFMDQGIGIPEERIPSLGEPFYTTKEKGTGLGLMTCYKIIEGHQGNLFISSKVNVGTTIEIRFPASADNLVAI
ncbi:ATP-binding protein [Bacillus sp. FJAT-49736]|uniref:ATP-binding protein n=1 Tax=Bacillus sp. FJAT-49736 TaxID=2833582 RepID=UPI001BC97F1E|nr:ATP-binding protein [Bacillus sp. FJAT-49736]MBS4174928.1 PAS domain S-box protein [Bacillus sp. FJAT-49736]